MVLERPRTRLRESDRFRRLGGRGVMLGHLMTTAATYNFAHVHQIVLKYMLAI